MQADVFASGDHTTIATGTEVGPALISCHCTGTRKELQEHTSTATGTGTVQEPARAYLTDSVSEKFILDGRKCQQSATVPPHQPKWWKLLQDLRASTNTCIRTDLDGSGTSMCWLPNPAGCAANQAHIMHLQCASICAQLLCGH
jgi:hypothetical protein